MDENLKEYAYKIEKKLNSFKNTNKDDFSNNIRRTATSKTERICLSDKSNRIFPFNEFINDKISPKNKHIFNDKEVFKRRLTQFYISQKSKSKLTYDAIKSKIKNCKISDDFSVEEDSKNLIETIKIENNERTPKDIINIKNFFIKSNLLELFHFKNSNDELLDKLLINSCINCKYKFMKKESILYKINDLVDNFYIVINGKIGIFKAFNKIKYMCGFKYFQYLYDLYLKNENYLLKIILEQNYKIFPIKENMLPELNINLAYTLIEKFKKNRNNFINIFNSVEDILMECFINPSNYNNDNIILNDDNFDYELLCETNEKKIIHIFEYNLFQEYIDGHYIEPIDNTKFIHNYHSNYENYKNNNNNYIINDRRLYMAKLLSDTHLCYFELNNYYNILLVEYKKILHKDAKFLMDNFFFKSISRHFEEKYFPFFEFEEININRYLFKENQSLDYIYFLKEGTVELSITKNIFQINSLLNELNLIKERKNYNNEENGNIKSNITSNNNNIYYTFNKRKLVVVEDKDIIGIECFYYNISYFYSAKIIEKSAIFYKIKKRKLLEIFESESEGRWLKRNYTEECKRKIEFFIKRLTHLTNVKLNLIQKKGKNLISYKDTKNVGRNSNKVLNSNTNYKNKKVKNLKKINELFTKRNSYNKNENMIDIFSNCFLHDKNKNYLSQDKKDIISKNKIKKIFAKVNNQIYSRNQNKIKITKKKNYFSQSEQNLIPSITNREKQKTFQSKDEKNGTKDSFQNDSDYKTKSSNSKVKVDIPGLMKKMSKIKKYKKNMFSLKSERYLLQKIQKKVIYNDIILSKIDNSINNNTNNLSNVELNHKNKINQENYYIKDYSFGKNEYIAWKNFHCNMYLEPISNKKKDKKNKWYKNINKMIENKYNNDYSSINDWIYGIKSKRNNIKLITNKDFFKNQNSLLSS